MIPVLIYADFAGACLNVVSSSIQLYNIVKEFAYDPRNPFLRDRLIKCCGAIVQATQPLCLALQDPTRSTATAAPTSPNDTPTTPTVVPVETNDNNSEKNDSNTLKSATLKRDQERTEVVPATLRFSSVDAVEKL